MAEGIRGFFGVTASLNVKNGFIRIERISRFFILIIRFLLYLAAEI